MAPRPNRLKTTLRIGAEFVRWTLVKVPSKLRSRGRIVYVSVDPVTGTPTIRHQRRRLRSLIAGR